MAEATSRSKKPGSRTGVISVLATASFWNTALARAAHAGVTSALGMIGAGSINVVQLPYADILGISAGAALISILVSIAQVTKDA